MTFSNKEKLKFFNESIWDVLLTIKKKKSKLLKLGIYCFSEKLKKNVLPSATKRNF